jgi:phosphotransferase system HPr (HPr) family protein
MSHHPVPSGRPEPDPALSGPGARALPPGQREGGPAGPLRRRVTITNPEGLHMRPAAAFAQRAAQFEGTVTLCKGEQRVNGKSPLEVMFLGAEQGTEIILEVSGADAGAAVEALAEILAAASADEAADA